MAVCRKLLLPSLFSILFCFSLLSANLVERSKESPLGEGHVSSTEEEDEVEYDGSISTVAADSSRGRVHPSTILPRHQALIFNPPSLDFREQSVGMPKLETVRITNPSTTQPLQLTSISGDSPTFHASFFRSKVVKAGGSTSFDVVFLARVVGSVRNILYIQSSQGTFEYEIQGIGTPNPFRLRSLLGARIPLNATYSPLISMYNPYSSPLQITEMYSSSGELHIELLTGQAEGAKALWEIRPYETKTIARASFFGGAVANHTSYVRVRTDHKTDPSVVLPVEVEVSDLSGLYLSRELLDFGVVKGGETKALPLYVLNTEQQQVHIKSVSVSPENKAIEIEYMTTLLRPGSKYTKIALLKLHADRVHTKHQMYGEVVIRAEDSRIVHQLTVPYDASVLIGSLSYDKATTLFMPHPPPFTPILRQIALSNQFESPVVVYDAKLPSKAQEYFAVTPQDTPFTLPPSREWQEKLSVVFLPSSSECFFNTTLRLTTNATYFNIPLFCYDGRVKYSLENPDEDALDFGVLSQSDHITKTLTVHNINPVQILITSFSVSGNLPFTTVELQSIHSTNSTPSTSSTRHITTLPQTLEPEHSALFAVKVTNPDTIGTYSGEVLVYTSYDKVLYVPVYFKTSESRLKVTPEEISFDRGFPHLRSKVNISVKNLYRQAVDVVSVSSDPDDPRVYFEESVDGLPRLKPMEKVEIGSVVFDPLLGDSENVYLSKPDSSADLWTSDTSSLRDPSREIKLWSSLWSSWKALVDDELTFFNVSVVVSSGASGDVRVPTTASLVWPDLVEERIVTFTPTIVGNTSIHRLHISNPSDQPLLVQPVLLSHYTHPQTIIDSLLLLFDPKLQTLNFSLASNSFSFVESSSNSETALSTSLLPPHSNQFEVAVAFSPKVDQEMNMLLLLRNNLTVFDYVVVQGTGVYGAFAIDGVQPGTSPLMFEVPNSVLENCQAGTLKDPTVDPLTLTKAFRMHNSGSTPIVLRIIGLEGGGCEGRGFSVSNCNKDITIKPNRSKKIEIKFTPDYTLTQVSNTLKIRTTSGNEFLYPLLAILPHQLLAACIALQPRPEWEKTLAWLSVPFWLFVILCIMATVFIQTKFGMKSSTSFKSEPKRVERTSESVFDLTKSVQASLTKKIQELEDKSASETTPAPTDVPEPPKATVETRKPTTTEPTLLTTNHQESVPSQLRHRTVSKPEKVATENSNSPTAVAQSKSAPSVVSTQKEKPTKIPMAPISKAATTPLTDTADTNSQTGVREDTQPCTPTTGAPVQVALSPTKSKRSEKIVPEKAPIKTPTETTSQSTSTRKSRTVRKLSSKTQLKNSPDASPVPTVGLKELERKASESSIISTDSGSTNTDKSEDVESPAAPITTLISEVKKPPSSFAKEPNTGQTIHPPDTPDSTEGSKSDQFAEAQKKESVTAPPGRIKGKKKLRQQKKEEKAIKKEKGREKDRERDKEKETEKPELTFKQSTCSLEDSSSSNSIEQLEEDTSPVEDPAANEADSEQPIEKSPVEEPVKLTDSSEGSSYTRESEPSIPPAAVSPAVPSSAIKARVKATKQQTKESETVRQPDRSSKKTSTKKPPEKAKLAANSDKVTSPTEEYSAPTASQYENGDSPRQRPQTLPVIQTEFSEDLLEDLGSAVETDGVASQGMLAVDPKAQSIPTCTSPHELAASLLSTNSAIMRRKQKSDKDKPNDAFDEEEDSDKDDRDRIEIKEPIEPALTSRKDGRSNHHSQYKPLSTLSLDAEPFYPSPHFGPKPRSNHSDHRKYPDYNTHPRGPPPGFSPTPEDPYAGPFPPDQPPYFKNLPRPPRVGNSMTPSPPLPYGAFQDGGPPLPPYGDYPPMEREDPYNMPEEFPPAPVGRPGEGYRGHSPMIVPKGGHRPIGPSMDSYMHRQQQLAHRRRMMREYGGYGPGWDQNKSHGMKPPPADDAYYQQYLQQRQLLTNLIRQEKAIAAMEREQARRSVDNTPMLGPDVSPSFGPHGWDNPEYSEPSTEDVDLLPPRQRQLLHEQSLIRPSRKRTYSTESDLGGEFVSDFPTPSTVGAPGQQFSSRAESSSSKAPGRAKSMGWPGDREGSSSNWDSPWSAESPFYNTDARKGTENSTSAVGPIGQQRSLSDNPSQPFSTTTYDLFKEQSIWSLSTSDDSLLSWAQLKSEQPESKTE